jgi:hypothetical protein
LADDKQAHPTRSPPSLTFQFNRPWTVLRPRLYRFLEAQYVEAFFKDGSLRLSSFGQFAKHPDEQRKDRHEGHGTRMGLGTNLTISTVQGRGHDCYVLCGSLNNTENVRKLFPHADAGFVIDDITAFANVISTKIPYVGGLEGFAIYQDETSITKNLGDITASALDEKYKNPDGTMKMEMLQDIMNAVGGPEEFFVKHSKYAPQYEYRLLWMTGREVQPFIDIKAPEEIEFCRRLTF